jgi:hypothetical protein
MTYTVTDYQYLPRLERQSASSQIPQARAIGWARSRCEANFNASDDSRRLSRASAFFEIAPQDPQPLPERDDDLHPPTKEPCEMPPIGAARSVNQPSAIVCCALRSVNSSVDRAGDLRREWLLPGHFVTVFNGGGRARS